MANNFQQIQRIQEFRDGIFQVAMHLNKEYEKYLDVKDARQCVINDLMDAVKKFNGKDVQQDNSHKGVQAITILKEKLEVANKAHKASKSEQKRYELANTIESIQRTIEFLEGEENEDA